MASCEFTPILRNGVQIGEKTRYRSRGGQIYNDAMALLLWVVKHPTEKQSYRMLARETGIPATTLKRMILWHQQNGKENCVLHYVAIKVGIIFKFVGKPEQIIFARYADANEQKLLGDSGNGPLYC